MQKKTAQKSVDSLIHARWIITVDTYDNVLEQHSIAITQGRIVAILPTFEAQKIYSAKTIFEFPGHAILPGLINAHTHASMSLLKGIADDLPLKEWLEGHIWPLERQFMSTEFVYAGTQLAIAEMLRGGVTCFNDMYFFPEAVADAARSAGIRASIGLILIDFPSAWAKNGEEYLTKGLALHKKLKAEPLLSTCFAPHAPYTASADLLSAMCQHIETLGENIPIHMHVHETAHEVESFLAQHGQRPLAHLEALGILEQHLLAVHMTQLSEEEITILAEKQIHVVHCPESNLKLASGFCPVERLLKAGVNVALGTDGNASNNDLDMFGEMRTAALLAKGIANDPRAVSAHTALRMATINAAKALGLDDTIGSLELGKAADIIAINLDELETRPLYDPISHLVYCASRQQLTHVWVAGQCLLQERQLQTLDTASLLDTANIWQERIKTKETSNQTGL